MRQTQAGQLLPGVEMVCLINQVQAGQLRGQLNRLQEQ
jgi:hypothetical protein